MPKRKSSKKSVSATMGTSIKEYMNARDKSRTGTKRKGVRPSTLHQLQLERHHRKFK